MQQKNYIRLGFDQKRTIMHTFLVASIICCMYVSFSFCMESKSVAAAAPLIELLEVSDADGLSPLHGAAGLAQKDKVLALLQAGCSLNVRDAILNTPLHVAIQEGHSEIAKLLLAVGAHAELYNALGFSPLHFAAERGDARSLSSNASEA